MNEPRQKLSPDFWRLWSAAVVSNLGDGIRVTALPLLIAAVTRDPLIVSGATAATFAPWILFSLPGGALVDRMDRRKVMIIGQAARGVVVAALAVLVAQGMESVIFIYLTAFVIGTGEVFVDTSLQASIPMLVPEPDLESANGKLLAAEFVTNDAVGGPVGAWLFALAAAVPFGIDAATFLIAGFLVSRIATPLTPVVEGVQTSLWQSIREGISFVKGDGLLRGLAGTVALANLATGAGGSILVLLALEELGLSELGFGLLIAAGALGGLLGAVVSRSLASRVGRRWTMTSGAFLLAVGQTMIGLAPNGWWAGAGLMMGTFGISAWSVVGRSLRQAVSPDRILGRVVTTFRLIGVGVLPLGALAGGAIAAAAGIRVPYLLGGAAILLVTGATYWIVTDERVAASIQRRARG